MAGRPVLRSRAAPLRSKRLARGASPTTRVAVGMTVPRQERRDGDRGNESSEWLAARRRPFASLCAVASAVMATCLTAAMDRGGRTSAYRATQSGSQEGCLATRCLLHPGTAVSDVYGEGTGTSGIRGASEEANASRYVCATATPSLIALAAGLSAFGSIVDWTVVCT
jgi:hypothetical protein